jgi:hypothetical protein
MAVIGFGGMVLVCGFFLYVLVQFQREEKYPRRHERPIGFPIVSSGQIVGTLPNLEEQKRANAAGQKHKVAGGDRRDFSL